MFSSLVEKWPLNRRARFEKLYREAPYIDLHRLGEFRSEAFPRMEPANWLDGPDAEETIRRRLAAGEIDAAEAEACRFWRENGYFIVPKLIEDAELDGVFAAYERALSSGRLGEPVYVDPDRKLVDRKLDAHLHVPELRALQLSPAFRKWTDLFLGRKTVPFQTIIGHAGSQQGAHSDSIHMTTYPLGFMVASWTAFEDIREDSGPLDYYPGSHSLPYLFSADVGIGAGEFKRQGYRLYHERYEPAVLRQCQDAGLERKIFLANKGDTLFWHANLVHGGTPRADPNRSRKALVCHAFAEGVVTYHDLSGNLSRLHAKGPYRPLTI